MRFPRAGRRATDSRRPRTPAVARSTPRSAPRPCRAWAAMADGAGGGRGRPVPWRRTGLVAVAGVLVAAGAAAAITAALSAPRGAASHGSGVQVASARVVRTDLTNTIQVGGSLGYAGSFTV